MCEGIYEHMCMSAYSMGLLLEVSGQLGGILSLLGLYGLTGSCSDSQDGAKHP